MRHEAVKALRVIMAQISNRREWEQVRVMSKSRAWNQS